MLRLYDAPMSTNAIKVRFLLAEMGVAWQRVPTPMASQRGEGDASLSPFGFVPVLDDDGFVLTESNTILRYLADREGRDDLYPRESRARARVDERMDAFVFSVRSALSPVEQGHRVGAVAPAATAALDAALDGFEGLLAGNGTATGAFSIADCCIAGRMAYVRDLPVALARWPRLDRLVTEMTGRDTFQEALR